MRIDIASIGRETGRLDHAAFLDMMQELDQLGYGGVWFSEFHFQTPPQPYPSLLLLAAAIFARTTRLRVGASVLVLPLHNPLLLAEQLAQLDWQSGGRIDIGVGRGTDPTTLALLEIEPDSTRERFEQAFALLRDIWAGTARGQGANGAAVSIPVQPCLQQPHPPVYIAGYTEDTLAFAGKHGLPLLLSLEPSELRQLEIYRQVIEREGFADKLPQSSLTRYIVIGETADDAEARLQLLLPLLQQRRIFYAGKRGIAPGDVAPIDRDRLLADQMIMGDASSCLKQIVELRESTGIQALRGVFNGNGVLPYEQSMEQMRLFAKGVLPALQGV